jgi:hypothetical protein
MSTDFHYENWFENWVENRVMIQKLPNTSINHMALHNYTFTQIESNILHLHGL